MRQFVHLQDSSWRSLFRNSNFSAQCRIVSASRQICTVPHVLSDRPAYPLPVILPIPLLLKSRKRGRCFNRCIYPSEAVRQRSVRPYDTADTAGKLSYPGRPSACHTRNGFDRVYRILQQLFSRLSTASQLPQPPGQKALHPLPSEQNAPKRHFTENERPDILNRTVPYQYTAQTYGKPQKIRPHTAASNLSRFVNKRSLRLYMRYAITLLSHRSEKCGQARSRARKSGGSRCSLSASRPVGI